MANRIVSAGLNAATVADLLDFIDESLAKAQAMARLSYGDAAAEGLNLLHPAQRDEYLHTLAGLIDQTIEAREVLAKKEAEARGPAPWPAAA